MVIRRPDGFVRGSNEYFELLWREVRLISFTLLATRECDLFHRVLDQNLILHGGLQDCTQHVAYFVDALMGKLRVGHS